MKLFRIICFVLFCASALGWCLAETKGTLSLDKELYVSQKACNVFLPFPLLEVAFKK